MLIEFIGDICKVGAAILFCIIGWKKLIDTIRIRREYEKERMG